MGTVETFYVHATDIQEIPESNNWESSLETAQENAENDLDNTWGEDEYIVFEISVRPLYKSVKRVDWQRV
jgi:hypothetical protein